MIHSSAYEPVKLEGGHLSHKTGIEYSLENLDDSKWQLSYKKMDKSGLARSHIAKPCAGALAAIKVCLIQFLETPVVVTLFRGMDESGACLYESIFTWKKGSSTLECYRFNEENSQLQWRWVFTNEGTEASKAQCLSCLSDWLAKRPTRKEQFKIMERDFFLWFDGMIVSFGQPELKLE